MADRPTLGDVRGPKENAVRETPPPVKEGTSEASPKDSAVDLTPVEIYRTRLKEAKIDEKEALVIIDALVSKGYYEEFFHLGTKKGTFRTRSYGATLRLQAELEFRRPQQQGVVDEIISRYNLASSLVEWNGNKYAHETDEEFEKTLLSFKDLGAPLVSFMFNRLAKFDYKISVIFSDEDGATALFSDPVG